MHQCQALVKLLEAILHDSANRSRHIEQFQRRVWTDPAVHSEPDIANAIRELAYDLDFFEPDERNRRTDPALFGESRMKQEVQSVLDRLSA